jgi:hypothetical protein
VASLIVSVIRVVRALLFLAGLGVIAAWALAPARDAFLRAQAIGVIAVFLVVILLALSALLRSLEFPMDAAFVAYTKFGPTLALAPVQRIRRRVWWASPSEITRWIADFDQVNTLIWNLAERGGAAKLGEDAVRRELSDAFPFLRHAGLRQAIFLVNYYAWHEGYDRA